MTAIPQLSSHTQSSSRHGQHCTPIIHSSSSSSSSNCLLVTMVIHLVASIFSHRHLSITQQAASRGTVMRELDIYESTNRNWYWSSQPSTRLRLVGYRPISISVCTFIHSVQCCCACFSAVTLFFPESSQHTSSRHFLRHTEINDTVWRTQYFSIRKAPHWIQSWDYGPNTIT